MNSLGEKKILDFVIEKHGGLERWEAADKITIHAETGGAALPLRFKFNAFRKYEAQIYTKKQHVVITPHPVQGRRGVFHDTQVWVETGDGEVISRRHQARKAFSDLRHKIWWDDLDTAHFGGYALWNYLTTPFLLLRPDIEIQELSSWTENGEKLRRFSARFPADLLTHSDEQDFYFTEEGLLRRHDYTAEVFGGWAKAAHYCWDHKEFDGLVFPTRRLVFPRKKNNLPKSFPTLVSINISNVKVD